MADFQGTSKMISERKDSNISSADHLFMSGEPTDLSTHSAILDWEEIVQQPTLRSPTPDSSPDLQRDRRPADPPVDVDLLCPGAIVYVYPKNQCGDPLQSWSTNLLGRFQGLPLDYERDAMRDLGYEHPAVILQHEKENDDSTSIIVANLTSFNDLPLENFLENCKKYLEGDKAAKDENIKFFNCIPVMNGGHDLPNDQYLHTTGGKLSTQSYLAKEGFYKVNGSYLRAYGVCYQNSYDMRLTEQSYKKVMKDMGLEHLAMRYTPLEELLAIGTPRTNWVSLRKRQEEAARELRERISTAVAAVATTLADDAPSAASRTFPPQESTWAKVAGLGSTAKYRTINSTTNLVQFPSQRN